MLVSTCLWKLEEIGMAPKVLHQPRVAWDLARTLVTVADLGGSEYFWLSKRLTDLLGTRYRTYLIETRTRLAMPRADRREVEIGLWRVRLEELMRDQADVAEDLRILGLHAASRLAHAGPA
jgi:hypothetical protein